MRISSVNVINITERAVERHMPLACFILATTIWADKLTGKGRLAKGLPGKGLTFAGVCSLGVDSMFTNGSAYRDRLDSMIDRSGRRRRLAAIPF